MSRRVIINKTKDIEQQKREYIKQLDIDKSFSIIISMWHKSLPYIKQCLDSIQCQTHFKLNRDYQIILGIDGYDEKTIQYIKLIKNDYRNLKVYYSQQNVGTYVMFNSLFQKSKYRNILRVDADDMLSARCIEIISRQIDQTDKIIKFKFKNIYTGVSKGQSTVKYSDYALGALCFTRNIFNKVGGYFQYRVACDRGFLRMCKKLNFSVKHISEYLYKRRVHSNQLTLNSQTGRSSVFRKKIKGIINMRSKQKLPINRVVTILQEI